MKTTMNSKRGFTLIELLVVIAIIAILSAILFPVFATVRENARAGTAISNMHQMSTALAQFQLDNKKYPDVLFGYVYKDSGGNIIPMDKALAQAQSDYNNGQGTLTSNPAYYFPGLYPEYIKDPSVFYDANNPTKDLAKDTGTLNTNVLCPSQNTACTSATAAGTLVVAANTFTANDQNGNAVTVTLPHDFYAADAFDSNPQILSSNTLVSPTVYVPRYQSAWTSIDNTLNCTDSNTVGPAAGLCNAGSSGPARNDYVRQMHWKNPPSDTYVVSDSYHVPQNNKVLVLFEGGNVKKEDLSDFQDSGANGATDNDVADISVGSNGVSQANFWKSPE